MCNIVLAVEGERVNILDSFLKLLMECEYSKKKNYKNIIWIEET
jgi:hypothetical protein